MINRKVSTELNMNQANTNEIAHNQPSKYDYESSKNKSTIYMSSRSEKHESEK